MKITRIATLFLLLTTVAGTHVIAASPGDSSASVSTTAEPGSSDVQTNSPLPSIYGEEDIPAFLRVDPCDTDDS